MKVSFEDAGPCRKAIHIDVPATEAMPEYEEVVQLYVRAAPVKGFRQGKAPRSVVEKRFSRDIVEETKDRLLPRLYQRALEQESVRPVAIVDLSDVTFDRQKGMHFKVTVDVPPQFKLPKYKKISLKGQPVEVKEEQVSAAIQQLLESRAHFEDAAARPAREGDLACVDYQGECEGKPVEEIVRDVPAVGKNADFWVYLGAPELLPGLAKGMVGMVKDEERRIPVAFPGDYRVAALAGKSATYTVRVKGIRERVLPKLDKELLTQLGVDSEDALKQKVRENLLQAAEANEKSRLKERIAEFLLQETKLDVPQTVVEHRTNQTIQNIVRGILSEGGTREDIQKQRDQILSAAARSAADRVKLSYILSRIADEETIQVTDAEVEERMKGIATRNGIPLERLKAALSKDGAEENLKSDIRADKAMDFLLENAKVKK